MNRRELLAAATAGLVPGLAPALTPAAPATVWLAPPGVPWTDVTRARPLRDLAAATALFPDPGRDLAAVLTITTAYFARFNDCPVDLGRNGPPGLRNWNGLYTLNAYLADAGLPRFFTVHCPASERLARLKGATGQSAHVFHPGLEPGVVELRRLFTPGTAVLAFRVYPPPAEGEQP